MCKSGPSWAGPGIESGRKLQPIPVFLPGESHGWRSMVGYSPWGRKESDTSFTHTKPDFPCALGFPCGPAGKESTCNVGDLGLIPGLGGPPGEGKGYPLQYSSLENSMNCIVYGVAKSNTTERLSLHRRKTKESNLIVYNSNPVL